MAHFQRLICLYFPPNVPTAKNQYRKFEINIPRNGIGIYIFPRLTGCLFCCRKYVDRSWEYINPSQTHVNVEIWTEAAQFPEKEYINGIFVAVPFKWNHMNMNPRVAWCGCWGRIPRDRSPRRRPCPPGGGVAPGRTGSGRARDQNTPARSCRKSLINIIHEKTTLSEVFTRSATFSTTGVFYLWAGLLE